ncbi:MAG TPA: tail fiber domain-containing protein, partial [Flavobacteriales bacterium]|nr:tail fiber domain-containing protein [Flavobacteriales bacterium]
VMIRRLVPDYENQELDRFVVTDNDGRLHWRSLANLPDNCEWTMSGTSPNHVITAVGAANNACPDAAENVGIGVSTPIAKLDVFDDTPASNDIIGLQCIVQGATDECIGAKITTGVSGSSGTYRIGTLSISRNGTDQNYGSRSKAELDVTQSGLFLHNHGQRGESIQTGGTTYSTCGLTGEASMTGGTATWNAGVYGRAVLGGSPSVTYNVGVYGIAENAGTDYGVMGEVNYTLDWAGFFKGRVNVTGKGFIPGGLWQNSDAQFKTNVQPLQGGLDALNLVQPRTFEYLTNQFRMFELPTGVQPGVVAQELQQVLPQLVTDVTFPEQRDSLGNVITAAFDYKAVNYVGFIPYLISAVQELAGITEAQQTTINTLQDEISTLQQDLATCCAAQGSTDGRSMSPGAGAGARLRQGFGDANAGAGEALRTDLFIVPNPVADHTQLRYTVATPGRTRLEVSDASGKRLEVLEEAVREAGAYTHDWT